MAAGMHLEDVPAEAREALESAIESGHARYLSGGEVVFTAAGFCAWYAAERRLIREQIAREIDAAERALSETDPATVESSRRVSAWCGGLIAAARIARRETTATTPTMKENSDA